MMTIRPAIYYVTAGAVGGTFGLFLLTKLSPFLAWCIAGLIMASIIVVSNEKLRKKFVLASVCVIAAGVVTGGLAALIYRLTDSL